MKKHAIQLLAVGMLLGAPCVHADTVREQQNLSATLSPLDELKMLSELPLSELKQPENQKNLARAAKQSMTRFSRDSSRKAMATNNAIGPQYVAELDDVTATFREKL